jgi:hypothetical protein
MAGVLLPIPVRQQGDQLMSARMEVTSPSSLSAPCEAAETCPRALTATAREGEIVCPVCYHVIPPEHIGYKLHCRRCGYLESCCNPF